MGQHLKLTETEVELSRAMKRLDREIARMKSDIDLLGK